MKRFYICLLIGLLGLSACFKDKLLVVGPPNDIDPADTTTAPVASGIKRKVLLIGVSGLRGDAMEVAQVPAIAALLPNAVYSYESLTQQPTQSGSGWASLLTGVWSNKHGVKDNSFTGYDAVKFPMAFRYVKLFSPKLRTVSIQSWPVLNQQLVSGADVSISLPDADAQVKDSAVKRLGQDDPDLLLVGFTGVKTAAHQFGYGPDVPEYMQAIEQADTYIGEILAALKARPGAAQEDWLVIIASDHGGIAKAEGGSSPEERNIFTLFHNKAFTGTKVEQPLTSLRAARYASDGQYAASASPLYNFDSIKQFTVQFNVRTRGFVSDVPFVGNKDWNSGNNPGWLLCPVGAGKWKFQAGSGSGRVDINSSAAGINDNRWHTIAITVDRRTGPGEVLLFQDGEPAGSSSLNNLSPFAPSGQQLKFVIGDDITGKYRINWGNDDFLMSNVCVWDTLWKKEDFKKYSGCDTTQHTNPYFSRMIGWWKGTGPNGNQLADASGRDNPLTVFGNPNWITQEISFCNVPQPAAVPQSVDVLPSIFAWLKIAADSGWGLDGISRVP
ncbi:alkaline phosphatase family protein [Chitinophaga caseinilytica]|uniref:Alkaline phosphatase family protein n=1 Tax=Chitinophaga caseinilytica TaxID=2267521 RepID=A0ABZ2ZBL1_9BACT